MATKPNQVDQLEDAGARLAPHTRMWLNAGAVTLGVGAAVVTGAAVASADTGADSGPSASHSAPSRPSTRTAASTMAKSRSADGVIAKTKAATRSAPVANSPTSIDPAPARASALRLTPSGSALAVASTTARAAAQPIALATPTPNSILQGLAEFGNNVFLTVTDQITVAQNNLAVLGEDVLTVLGISRETITDAGTYGNPGQNKQYYVPMADYATSPLATVAMAYGQLTSTAPDLLGFTVAARTTPSLAYPGWHVYNPGYNVAPSDSYELLQNKKVRFISTTYSGESSAINALYAGLSDPTKVMIAQVTGPVGEGTDESSKTVVVLGLDTTNDLVTINDPTQSAGQGLVMKLEDFTQQWSAQGYRLVTAQLAASSSTPVPEPATKLVWSLPAPNEIGQALQAGLTNLATLVVHQIQGAQTSLGVLADDLSYTFGITSADIAPPASQSIEYGNYTKNYPYYYYQGDYASCVLMATAAMIAQLDGVLEPDLANEIFDLAEATPSGYAVNQNMFYPDVTDPKKVPKGQHYGTYYVDALKLLDEYGVSADMTRFTSSQSDLALDTLNNALSAEQAVMVAVSSDVIWTAYSRKYFGSLMPGREPGINPNSDHAVVVISVDATKNVVYLNDSALKSGQGFPIPLEEFMRAWQASNYMLITGKIIAT